MNDETMIDLGGGMVVPLHEVLDPDGEHYDVQESVMQMIASDREEAEGRALAAEAEVERLRALLARCVGETSEDEQERGMEVLGDR